MNNYVPEGARWVFFSSASPEIIEIGKTRLKPIISNLSHQHIENNSIQENIDNIGKYLTFIKEMADSSFKNEQEFIKQSINLLDKNDPIQNHLKEFLTDNFDYIKFIALLNELMISSKEDEKILEQTINNIKAVEKVNDKFNEISQEKMRELYNNDHMLQYRGMFFSKAQGFYDDYETSYNNLLSTKINKALDNLTASSKFRDDLIELYNNSKTQNISDDDFKRIIVNFIIDEVLSSSLDTTDMKISKDAIEKLKKDFIDITKIREKNYIDAAESATLSIEEIVLTKKGSIANYIRDLNIDSLKQFEKDFKINNELKKIIEEFRKLDEKADANNFKRLQREISIKLNKIIKDQTLNSETLINKKISSKRFLELSKSHNFILHSYLKDNIFKSIKGFKITHDALAEAMVQKDVDEKIKSVIISNIPGKAITFKADIRFSTGYIEDNLDKILNINEIKKAINEVLTQYYNDFFILYKDKTGGQTDIAKAMEAYEEWIIEIQNSLDNIASQCKTEKEQKEMKEQLYKALESTFSTSVSVKDYDLYNNTLGVHGGKLGSGKAPQKVMENIYKMYELGGITAIDVDMLMAAVDNCGDAMIGGSPLRQPLENYLLGGAALIMFDDSFALSKNFLDNMKTKLKGQKVVNLYKVNTRYIPASFVLNKVYDNLKEIYNNILKNNPLPSNYQRGMTSYVTITNNNDDSILNNEKIKKLPIEDRWKAVKDEVENNILIQFTFMAGLLDILDNLPKAFNNI